MKQRRRASGRGRRKSFRPLNVEQALIASLGQRWQKYRLELRRCRRTFSEESVHDLRVATRRLISTLTIVEIVHPDPKAERLRRRLKRLFDTLSPLRDTQVQLLTIEKKSQQYAELATLLTILKVRERRLIGSAMERVGKFDSLWAGRTISALKREVHQEFALPIIKRAGMNAIMGVAAGRFIAAVERKEHVVATRPRTIHRARIAFKKFRYTIEALSPVVPDITSGLHKAMDAYQTRMGNIQDCNVLGGLFRTFARGRPLSSRRKLSGFRNELLSQRKELTAAYLQSAGELYRFGRPLQGLHAVHK